MMELIQSLQRKSVEEGDTKVASDDAEECGDGESEGNDDALAKEEDDGSMNEDEQDSADAVANAKADESVKIVVEMKEGGKDDKTKVGVTGVVDVVVEEKAGTKKRKGNAETVTDGAPAKRVKKNIAVVEEVASTPVKRTRKSGDVDNGGNGSPAVSSGRRVTRSSANASEADDSPARRTRSRARADAGC
jgi:E3 ubiquitin-protein ligase UHRF1